MNPDKVPPSDEVVNEKEARREQEMQEREAQHRKAQIDDHNARVEAAQAFDWDAWEEETGLTRPEIPKKI